MSIMSPLSLRTSLAGTLAQDEDGTKTNIKDALKHPRTENSMPGKYPGKVVKLYDPESVVDDKPQEVSAYKMLAKGMLMLTGEAELEDAWRQFVNPNEIIGLKVNPVAGKPLSTSHAVTKSIIRQLKEAGIPKENIVIWDRREMQLHETGYNKENYPGIKIQGTEQQDADGGFYDKEGILYGDKMIDKDWYYWADCEQEYDAYTLPYMVNSGKYSYFSKICTQEVDKIINVPILKNAGPTVTLCLKNLAYGSITNTGRLHKPLWSETCAEVCAFPPLRDKVVLNIVDGLRGCFEGGPGANPQFICNYHNMLIGTDPVAVDRIGYDIVIAKRIEEGVQEEDSPRGRKFMKLAEKLELGVADREKIELIETEV
ncbi:MAG: DUF362 domain-containing protein [Bacteroidales bacterium]|nr:DUF362 domain-containing protein [Bacteroidales bacterium]MCF8345282.1 DUF362 domain-containing protein [Bacteroidales bacterium]MCF8349768.1 DUF362 domain-containing protein [Bacteroidales bacterium]MCF8376287.1 DUF362 domain-containing protein [Bacteroidales bacterium]MCF8401582.1 DUF362 domain-containing protein [Bacteroidales bacterium]